jgi:DNA-binding transcriptional MerR regulator
VTDNSGLSIGEVAARTGLSVHALRFYERDGLLLCPVHRATSGHRAYTEDDVEWLQICVSFRSSGMPLNTLRRYAALVRDGEGNEGERLSILRQHRDYLEAQLAQLVAFVEVIDLKVNVYEKRLAEGTASTLWDGSTS